MDSTGDLGDVIENFLNGHYMDFQKQIASIAQQMTFDPFFGNRLAVVMKEIRKKALIQYVSPYKVIDMREISKAFELSIVQVEAEIAELIVSKQIQAKIDSHSKVRLYQLITPQLLYSKKDNETLNSYKEAVELGRKFIEDTEAALLHVLVLQKNKTLKSNQGN